MRSPNETAPETRNRSSKWPVTVRGRLIKPEKELHNKRGTISFCAHWLLNSMHRVYNAAEQSLRKKTKKNKNKNTPPWCGEVKRAPGFQLPSSPHWARRQAVAFQKGDKTLATALLSGKGTLQPHQGCKKEPEIQRKIKRGEGNLVEIVSTLVFLFIIGFLHRSSFY